MVVENTNKPDDTLRNLRWDFITYQEDDKTIVESRGRKAEIRKERSRIPVIKYHRIDIVPVDSEWNVRSYTIPGTYRYISFPNSDSILNIDISKLSNKYKWKKDEQYKEHLYLPKIANFMNRMIYNYIDTESRNKENSIPFSINKLWDLVFDDDPYNVNLDKIENSEKENMEEKWAERKEEKQKPWNNKLVCLRNRSTLGINDKKTKEQIVSALNFIVYERLSY